MLLKWKKTHYKTHLFLQKEKFASQGGSSGLFLYPQHTKYAMGYIVFVFSVCLSVCQSVSLSVKIYFVSKISQQLLYLET